MTPLIAMVRALNAQGLGFEFHYFVQSDDHAAFKREMGEFASVLTLHKGLPPEETATKLRQVLSAPGHARHVYICGPGPMLEVTRKIAAGQGWADKAIHFEYFKNTTVLDSSNSFEIELARSALALKVPAGRSILDVLRDNGINLASSCEQGACGTCRWAISNGVYVIGDATRLALLQSTIPLHQQGRALSLLTSIMGLAGPVGMVLAIPLGEWIGVRWLFVLVGSVAGCVSLLAFRSRALMQLGRSDSR